MRTTIDLPDPLFRAVKARAALEGRKLKDLLAEYVRQGLAQSPAAGAGDAAQAARTRRGPPPVIIRAAATGQVIPALTNAEVAAILDEEDARRAM